MRLRPPSSRTTHLVPLAYLAVVKANRNGAPLRVADWVCAGAWPRLRRNRVSLFYQEKLLMLLHFCQTFGLMRMLSCSQDSPESVLRDM